MTTLTILLVAIGMAATVAALLTGILSMAHGGDFDDRHSHQLMFARVGFQALTVALVVLALLLL